jgi:transcriptional regulator with XRE-family HTH domain
LATQGTEVLRWALGVELKAMRTARGWTLDQAAKRLGRVESSLSKIENGRQRVLPSDLLGFFRVYEINDPVREAELLELARKGNQRTYPRHYKGVVRDPLKQRLGLEVNAEYIGTLHTILVPGLLQTEAYALAVVEASRKWEVPEQIQQFVNLRMERQAVLTREHPPQLWVVLTEAVVRQNVGGRAVMREQIAHLDRVSERTNITIQLLPYSAGAYAGMDGPFTVMRLPKGPTVVIVDGLTTSDYLGDEAVVAKYETTWDLVKSSALSPRETRAELTKITKELS